MNLFTVKGYLPDSNFVNKSAPDIVSFSTIASKLSVISNNSEYCIPEYTPIGNQGSAGSCVANAFCDGLEILIGVQQGADKVVQLSRRHLYWIARNTHNSTQVDGGTYLRAAAWQLQKIGVMPEKYYPYSDKIDDIIAKPPLSSYTMASENRVTGHFRITTTGQNRLDEIERAIRANHPVTFGTRISDTFKKANGKSVLKPTASTIGGHAMLVVGVRKVNDRREFKWRNSWGTRWGDHGYIWVDELFMTWNRTTDLWVLTRMQEID